MTTIAIRLVVSIEGSENCLNLNIDSATYLGKDMNWFVPQLYFL